MLLVREFRLRNCRAVPTQCALSYCVASYLLLLLLVLVVELGFGAIDNTLSVRALVLLYLRGSKRSSCLGRESGRLTNKWLGVVGILIDAIDASSLLGINAGNQLSSVCLIWGLRRLLNLPKQSKIRLLRGRVG